VPLRKTNRDERSIKLTGKRILMPTGESSNYFVIYEFRDQVISTTGEHTLINFYILFGEEKMLEAYKIKEITVN
jgi:hypothetical protein